MNAPTPGSKLSRSFTVSPDAVDLEARTLALSFSSEAPFQRSFGFEILSHARGAADLTRLNTGAPLLLDHDSTKLIGVVESAEIDAKGVGRAIVRFSTNPLAEQTLTDIKDGIRRNVSVGYWIDEVAEGEKRGNTRTFIATRWTPFEISSVSVPADSSVGVGRSADAEEVQMNDLEEIEAAVEAAEQPAEISEIPDAEDRAVHKALPEVTTRMTDNTEALRIDRERQKNIRALAARVQGGVPAEIVERFCEEGRSIEDFTAEINSRQPESRAIRKADDPSIGMTDKEINKFSYFRLLRHLAEPGDMMLRNEAGFELEVSKAARNANSKGTVTIPYDVLRGPMRRDLVVGTNTAGGNLVATDFYSNNFIDMLRNRMVTTQMGATVFDGLNGNVAIPSQTGGATVSWLAENTSVTPSQASFGQVTMTPKNLLAMSQFSRSLLIQSAVSIEDKVRSDLVKSVALELDRVAFHGSGSSGQPKGILNQSGLAIEIGGTNGAAPTLDNIINLETLVASANADIATLGYVSTPKARGKLKRTQKFSGTNGDPIWEQGDQLNGYRAVASNQISSTLTKGSSSTCSAIVFGNYDDLLIGLWSGIDLLVDPYSNSASGAIRVTAYQNADIAVRHVESFAAMVDALTV